MMVRLFFRFIFLVSVLLLQGCVCRDMEIGRGCHELNDTSLVCGIPRKQGTSRVKIVEAKCPEYCEDFAMNVKCQRLLADKGETYTRRGDYTLDISNFAPDPDESYEVYRQRMMNTLAMQEMNQQNLVQAIEEIERRLQELRQQEQMIRSENVDLRLNYAEGREEEEEVNMPSTRFQKYVIVQDDTLQKIAFRHYGTHSAWLSIYRYNLERLPYGPNRILPGTVLLLPSVELVHTRMEMSEAQKLEPSL